MGRAGGRRELRLTAVCWHAQLLAGLELGVGEVVHLLYLVSNSPVVGVREATLGDVPEVVWCTGAVVLYDLHIGAFSRAVIAGVYPEGDGPGCCTYGHDEGEHCHHPDAIGHYGYYFLQELLHNSS